MVLKMEAKLRDLESDLENEQRKTQDVIKQQRKQERKQKEIAYQVFQIFNRSCKSMGKKTQITSIDQTNESINFKLIDGVIK